MEQSTSCRRGDKLSLDEGQPASDGHQYGAQRVQPTDTSVVGSSSLQLSSGEAKDRVVMMTALVQPPSASAKPTTIKQTEITMHQSSDDDDSEGVAAAAAKSCDMICATNSNNNKGMQLKTSLVKRSSDGGSSCKRLVALDPRYNCQTKSNHWLALTILAVVATSLLANLTNLPNPHQLAEAKTHHSKRQAPVTTTSGGQQQQQVAAPGGGQLSVSPSGQQPQSNSLTGRESTNWWNVWWQRKFLGSSLPDARGDTDLARTSSNKRNRPSRMNQAEYINEAVEPTVRPIVAVSFNDRTIKLGGASNSERSAHADADHMADLTDDNLDQTNMVVSRGHDMSRGSGENEDHEDVDEDEVSPMERQRQSFGQSERLRLMNSHSSFDNNLRPSSALDTKQMLLAQKKSMQQQAQWQSVKPTIIQPMAAVQRDSRPNRQVAGYLQQQQEVDGANFGIQMRNSLSQQPLARTQQQQQQQQQPRWKQLQLEEQRRQQVNTRNSFVQQQQQFLDDARFEQQQNQMLDYTEEAELDSAPELQPGSGSQGASQDEPAPGPDRARAKGVDSSSSSMMANQQNGGGRNAEQMVPLVDPSRRPSQAPAAKTGSTKITTEPEQRRPTTFTQQPTTSGDISRQRSMRPATQQPTTAGASSTSLSNEMTGNQVDTGKTTTAATQAPTTTAPTTPPARTTSGTVDLNETPVSLGSRDSNRANPPATSTTPTGRVQLENGRPANGMRQMGVTSSARLPTISTNSQVVQSTTVPTTVPVSTTTTAAPSTTPASADAFTTTTTQAPSTVITTTTIATTTTSASTSASPTISTTTTAAAPSTTTKGSNGSQSTNTVAGGAMRDMTTIAGTTIPGKTQSDMIQTTPVTVAPTTTKTTTSAAGSASSTASNQDAGTVVSTATDSTTGESEGDDSTTGGSAANSPEGGESSDDNGNDEDDEDSTGSSGDETTTTTPASNGSTSGGPTTTTQSPTAPTVELTRLPKVQQTAAVAATTTTMATGMNLMRAASMQEPSRNQEQQMPASAGGSQPGSDDIARIRPVPNSAMVQEDESPMTASTMSRMPVGDETAITMPMDTLVDMMKQAGDQDNQRGMMATETPIELNSQTTSTSAPRMSDFGDRTMANQQAPANDGAGGSGPSGSRRRLQPPPTTQMPSLTPSSSMNRRQQPQQQPPRMSIPAQTSAIGGGDGASQSPDMAAPVPKMVMVSVQSPMGMAQNDNDGRTEMLNLDLMPIQRIMNNEMLSMMVQQQQQRQKEMERLNKQQMGPMIELDDGNGGKLSQGDEQIDKVVMMPVVEPGMRLRPPKVQQPSDELAAKQQPSAIVMGNQNPANTMYTVMMGQQATSGPKVATVATGGDTKRPRPPVPAMTTTLAMTSPPSTVAPTTSGQQRERLMTTKSIPTTMQTTTQTRQPPVSTTQNLPTTTGAMQPTTTTQMRQGDSTPTMTMATSGQLRTQPTTVSQWPSTTTTMSNSATTGRVPTTFTGGASTKGGRQPTTLVFSGPSTVAMLATTARPRLGESMMSMTEMEIKRQREQAESMRGRLSMAGSEQQTAGPMTTTTTITTAQVQQQGQGSTQVESTTTTTTTSRPTTTTLATTGDEDQSTTTGTKSSESETSSSSAATTTTAATSTQTTTTTPTPTTTITISSTPELSQTTKGQQQSGMSTTLGRQTDSTTTAAPVSTTAQLLDQTATTGAQQQRLSTMATNEKPGDSNKTGGQQQQPSADAEVTGSGGNQQVQLERVQQQPTPSTGAPMTTSRRPQQQQQQQQPKTSGVKSAPGGKVGKQANLTSSFIPLKLRNDFNKFNRLQEKPTGSPTTTTQSSLTGAAIRQFGGANRMSLIGKQPVPFGRPAAMTMHSSANRLAAGNNQRVVELPTFEYGPSIAVRRPDEPLANGQVPNCTLTGKNFCVLTKDYPMNEVRQAVERSFRSVRIMYEELQTVSDQELHKDDFNATNNQAATGKFACQTQVEMMRPGWAKDEITKEWMLVVNTDVFPQRVRTESCAQPNTPCEFIAPFYDSTCQQRYSLHRMIAIDPHDPSRSPQVAVFRFPAGCVCRVHPIRKTTTANSTTPAARS